MRERLDGRVVYCPPADNQFHEKAARLFSIRAAVIPESKFLETSA